MVIKLAVAVVPGGDGMLIFGLRALRRRYGRTEGQGVRVGRAGDEMTGGYLRDRQWWGLSVQHVPVSLLTVHELPTAEREFPKKTRAFRMPGEGASDDNGRPSRIVWCTLKLWLKWDGWLKRVCR